MKLVIDIDDSEYEEILKDRNINYLRIIKAIKNGTLLPKGHGRLIDADKLLDSDGIIADSRKCHYIPVLDVYFSPTIIEADGGSK